MSKSYYEKLIEESNKKLKEVEERNSLRIKDIENNIKNLGTKYANATSTQLQELYIAYFGRAADPTGIAYWPEKGTTQASFAEDMYASAEFKSEYGSLSTEAQVNKIYQNLFDRDGDPNVLLTWTQQINEGNMQLSEVAGQLIAAAVQTGSSSSADKIVVDKKTAAAETYTAAIIDTAFSSGTTFSSAAAAPELTISSVSALTDTSYDLTDTGISSVTSTAAAPELAISSASALTGTAFSSVTSTAADAAQETVQADALTVTSTDIGGTSYSVTDTAPALTDTPTSQKYETLQNNIKALGYILLGDNPIGPNSNLEGLDLTSVDLTNVKSGNIKSNNETILPDDYKIINGYIIGPNVDLTGANLEGADLEGANLENATLIGVRSGNIKSNSETILPDNYKIINGYIIGPNVDLRGADLKDNSLANTSLEGANLEGANLEGALLEEVGYNYLTRFPKEFKPTEKKMVNNNNKINIKFENVSYPINSTAKIRLVHPFLDKSAIINVWSNMHPNDIGNIILSRKTEISSLDGTLLEYYEGVVSFSESGNSKLHTEIGDTINVEFVGRDGFIIKGTTLITL